MNIGISIANIHYLNLYYIYELFPWGGIYETATQTKSPHIQVHSVVTSHANVDYATDWSCTSICVHIHWQSVHIRIASGIYPPTL